MNKYCINCGKKLKEGADVCLCCGKQVRYTTNTQSTVSENDTGSFGWAVLGFFFPIVGIVLFAIWNKTKPNDAKKSLIGAIVGFVVPIIMFFIFVMFALLVVVRLPDEINNYDRCHEQYGERFHYRERRGRSYCCSEDVCFPK